MGQNTKFCHARAPTLAFCRAGIDLVSATLTPKRLSLSSRNLEEDLLSEQVDTGTSTRLKDCAGDMICPTVIRPIPIRVSLNLYHRHNPAIRTFTSSVRRNNFRSFRPTSTRRRQLHWNII